MTTATDFVPTSVPSLDMVDTGRWRDLGITHWHVGTDDANTKDQNFRFSAERWHGLTGARYAEAIMTPVEAWTWVIEARMAALQRASDPGLAARRAGLGTPEDWEHSCSMSWWMLTQAKGFSSTGVAISEGRVVDIFAEGMTAMTCGRHK